jgi:transcriptional/translational regulatory protein YebC/TACO1
MQINVKVNEKNVLEETYTITLDRDEIEQVEQALLDQRFKIMTFIQSARGEEALDLIDEHEDLKQLEKLIERIQLSHLFIYGENK